jgi:hypothetical protein
VVADRVTWVDLDGRVGAFVRDEEANFYGVLMLLLRSRDARGHFLVPFAEYFRG